MAPSTVHLVRHAQGFHNISVVNHAIHDPQLTPTGEDQCKALQKNFPFMSQIDCVVASPLKRTLNTALLSFSPAIRSKNLRVIALPELQETSDLPCDTGSDPPALEHEFKGKPVDFSIMYTPEAKDWNSKSGNWAPTASAIDERARVAREWLHSRPEKEIVVVSHGGFLHYFTQDWVDTHKLDGTPSAGKSRHHSRRHTFDASPTHPPISHPRSLSSKRAEATEDTITPHHHHHHQHHHHHTHDADSHSNHKHERSKSSPHHKRSHKHRLRLNSYLVAGTGWANTEYRSYIFDTSDGEISLVETPESRKKRVGEDKPLSKEEQKNLQRTKQQSWAEQEEKEKAYQKANSIQAKLRQLRQDRDLGGYGYGF